MRRCTNRSRLLAGFAIFFLLTVSNCWAGPFGQASGTVQIRLLSPETIPRHFDDVWTVQVFNSYGDRVTFSEDGFFGEGDLDLTIPRDVEAVFVQNFPIDEYMFRLMSGSAETSQHQPVYFAEFQVVVESEYSEIELTEHGRALARAGNISQVYVCDPFEGRIEGKIFATALANSRIILKRNGETTHEASADEFGDFNILDIDLAHEGLTELNFELDQGLWEIPDFGITVPGGWYLPKALFVDVNATGANIGLGWLDAYTDLEMALDHWATSFYKFEIWVADGIYRIPASATGKFKPTMQIYGGFSGNETDRFARQAGQFKTVLSGDIGRNDGTNSDGVVVDPANHLNGVNTPRLFDISSRCDRFTIIDSVTITAFSGSSSAVRLGSTADISLLNLDFVGNENDSGAAAIELHFQCRAVIDSVKFLYNVAYEGGAIEIANFNGFDPAGRSTPLSLVRCYFEQNDAELGGCIVAESMPLPLKLDVLNCTFVENKADNAGVIYLANPSGVTTQSLVRFGGCVFNGNKARSVGGVVFLELQDPRCPRLDCDFTNCTFANNQARYAAIGYARSHGTAQVSRQVKIGINSSIAWSGPYVSNYEILVYGSDAEVKIRDSIMQFGTNGTWAIAAQAGATSYVWSGVITNDPMFVDQDGADGVAGNADDNLRLKAGAPAIDKANATWNAEQIFGMLFDVDWNFRKVNGKLDMGAYEKQ